MSEIGSIGGGGGAGTDDDPRPENIRVVARVKPCDEDIAISVQRDGKTLQVVGVLSEKKKNVSTSYCFDRCLDTGCSQAEMFEQCGIKLLLHSALDGFSSTCFAYGQTGSGKTHTIVGSEGVHDTLDQRSSEGDGMISRSMKHIFKEIEKRKDRRYAVYASYCEIYNEQVRDMLAADVNIPLPVKWDPNQGFFVPKMMKMQVKSKQDIMKVFCKGFRRTRVGSHDMNNRSNRSHCIFSVYLECQLSTSTGLHTTHGKMTFVDLAGSERQKLTGSSSEMLRESGQINKSLFTLGKVISILSENKESAFVPYRDSKLTKLLKDSIGGAAKTLMITCCSSSTSHIFETLQSLEFASRAMNIRNKPVVVLDPKEALIRDLKREIKRLKHHNNELQRVVNSQITVAPSPFGLGSNLAILPGGGTVPRGYVSRGMRPVVHNGYDDDDDDGDYDEVDDGFEQQQVAMRPSRSSSGSRSVHSRERVVQSSSSQQQLQQQLQHRLQPRRMNRYDNDDDDVDHDIDDDDDGDDGVLFNDEDEDEDEDVQQDIISRTRMFMRQQPAGALNEVERSLMEELESLVAEKRHDFGVGNLSLSGISETATAKNRAAATENIGGWRPTTSSSSSSSSSRPNTQQHLLQQQQQQQQQAALPAQQQQQQQHGHRHGRGRRLDEEVEEGGVWDADKADAEQEMAELENELAQESALFSIPKQNVHHRRPYSQDSTRAMPWAQPDPRGAISARTSTAPSTTILLSKSSASNNNNNNNTRSRAAVLSTPTSVLPNTAAAAAASSSSSSRNQMSRDKNRDKDRDRDNGKYQEAPDPASNDFSRPQEILNELDMLKTRVDRAEAAIRLHMDVMSSWQG